MPSERVQHAYGLIQKTLQQSGIIHNSGSQQTGSASNPYGYSNVPQQQTSWQQVGPPPPPPSVPGYGPNTYVSVPGRPPVGPGPPAPPLMTPTQVTYSSPPISPPYRPLQSQSQQGWMPTIQSNVTAATTTNPHNPTQGAQQQGFSSIFPPPPPPPKPHQYSAQPPPLPPRAGTQDPPPNQTSSWPRPPMQTTQSVSNFQDSPQTAHPIYRKYGHVIQGNGGAPSYGFTSSNVSHGQSFGTTQQPSQPSYQSIQSPVPQQSAWQAPTSQQPDVSPIQQHAQPYAATHTPVNQSAGPPSHIFQSPATHTPPTVPSVSPPPYSYAFPPPPPGEPPQFDYFGRSENSTKSQAQFQRPSSHGNNPYDPPVSPPIPHVSPLVSRQGSLASQPGRSNERQDTVSSVSTAPMHERHDTVSSISTAAVDRPVTPKVETSGAVDLQSGAAVTAGNAAGTSASALGFGGPGGWEYYAPLEGDSEDDAGDVGKGKAKEEAKEEDREPISPVELPSEPIVTKEDVGVQKKEEQDMEEEGIYELPADFSMAETVKPADSENRGTEQDVSETTDLPKPSTRYNRIPRPQDLIPDLGPWYASSLERYISMLKQEAYSISDEQRAAAFVEFVAVESRVRGIPYYTQPPAQNQEQTTDELQRKPKLPLEIPAVDMNNAATEDMQYSPGGRPILRAKAPDRRNTAEEVKTAIVRDDHRPYKPFRQNTFPADSEASSQPAVSTPTSLANNETENTGQSAPVASQKQPQYKPYTPGTPTVETIRRESFPHRYSISSPTGTPTAGKHEHGETFFPAPLALRAKKDRTSTPPASTSTAPPRSAEKDKLSTPSAVPYPATPSQTPPPPEPPAASTKPSSTPPSSETGIARLAALLAKPLPTTPSPDTARIQQTLSALPSLDATRAHIIALRAAFDATTAPSEVGGAATAQAKTLFAALASERADTQTLNDMAFEANELTYPELLARDDALKRGEVERVAGEAERVGREEGRAYGRWEGEVFAGVYGRVRQEVDGGVEGLAVVEDVGAGAVWALSSGEENGKEESAAPAASGLVKINARTGEVMVVEGLAQGGGGDAAAPSTAPPPPSTTKKQAKHTAVETALTALRTLNESTRALLNLHAHISARHVLLAETVAERDARYARAQVAPLEFLVAFDDLENPAAAGAAAIKNSQSDEAEQRSPDDDDTRTKLRDLERHFASARLGAAARAAADEEVRARQTWQRVEGWMAAGVAAVARTVGEIMDAVAEVERVVGSGEVRELLDRAERVVKDLSGGAGGLVRAFYDVEVLLNEAEFAVSVEEARVAVFEKAGGAGGAGGAGKGEKWEKEAESVIGKLKAEKGKEDGVLKEELQGRLRKLGEEQKDKGIRAVRKARAKVVGREEFGDEDRIVGWVT